MLPFDHSISSHSRCTPRNTNSILLTPSVNPIFTGTVLCTGDPPRSVSESLQFFVTPLKKPKKHSQLPNNTPQDQKDQDENQDEDEDDVCAFCLDPHDSNSVQLNICSHNFHLDCLQNFAKCAVGGLACPLCKKFVVKDRGPCPPGTMSWAIYPPGPHEVTCTGYSHYPAVVIDYSIPSGIQGAGHPSPGSRFEGARRFSFFPLTKQGLVVLDMLARAFEQGHTFCVGTSLTTGRKNAVVWNGIHHKTRPDGGEYLYGWPDDTYFDRVLEELRLKGLVPRHNASSNNNNNNNNNSSMQHDGMQNDNDGLSSSSSSSSPATAALLEEVYGLFDDLVLEGDSPLVPDFLMHPRTPPAADCFFALQHKNTQKKTRTAANHSSSGTTLLRNTTAHHAQTAAGSTTAAASGRRASNVSTEEDEEVLLDASPPTTRK